MIVNEKHKFNKEWLDLMLENKNNANLTFNISDNDTRILLTYIEVLQQENARLKDKIDKAINLLEDNQFIWSAMDDEILKILKEN